MLVRLLSGLAAAVIFTLISSLQIKVALALAFAILALALGKKIRPLPTLLMCAAIVIFNLYPPYGKVLFEAGPFALTQGALAGGIAKAANIEGLLFLSKAVVSRDADFSFLPGKAGAFGQLLGETFACLEKISLKKDAPAAVDRGKGRGPFAALFRKIDYWLQSL